MKFTLHEYQDQAVAEVLTNLRKARKRWREDAERNAFSLTAVTGAGKTVMAAAVFEALFYGENEKFHFDPDSGAVVIWFSDDPSLNEQTRFRLMESSDRIQHTDLVVVENTFNQAKFNPGKIYFLNTQKLSKKSLLVRGHDADDGETLPGFTRDMRPDLRSYTIWDTIRNTIEDPALTLYLVLDEAHRGMGGDVIREKSTIVKRLINGEKGVPGIPVVWGISATVARFDKAMEGAQNRSVLPGVAVDTAMVQESGLLKDTVVLDIPDEAGDFDTALVRRAADKLRECSKEWAQYTEGQNTGESVVPLMVLQVQNKPNHKDIGQLLDVIYQQWPELPPKSVAHVFGEHTTQTFGAHEVPYIPPQRVQEDTWVRVLVAKDAISTGWDCPRAEVMVSFRPAKDETYIAQLLGRMVRSPLARRIPGNDRLNSVDCLLPKFDRKTVELVVKALREGGADTPPTGRVLITPQTMEPNPAVPQSVWDKFVSLPSQTRPRPGAKPAIRLTALAHELASDGLLSDAGSKAHAAMHDFLDGFIAERQREFDLKRQAVTTVEGRTVIADLNTGVLRDGFFEEDADEAVIGDAFRRTARILSPDIARTYTMIRANRRPEAEQDLEDALIEAREEVAALHLLENLRIHFDAAAKKLSDEWLAEYRAAIKALPDERQEAYREIVKLSTEPEDVDLAMPVARIEPTKSIEKDGTEIVFPAYPRHLLCDAAGLYPCEIKGWELDVFKTETEREGFRFWYRNPSRPSQDSLGIAYKVDDKTQIVRPDFIFFAEENGVIVADIVDPHGVHLADAIPKLKGLALYAETHFQHYRRIESVAKVGGSFRVLDLTREDVRMAVLNAGDAHSLYQGSMARDYV